MLCIHYFFINYECMKWHLRVLLINFEHQMHVSVCIGCCTWVSIKWTISLKLRQIETEETLQQIYSLSLKRRLNIVNSKESQNKTNWKLHHSCFSLNIQLETFIVSKSPEAIIIRKVKLYHNLKPIANYLYKSKKWKYISTIFITRNFQLRGPLYIILT